MNEEDFEILKQIINEKWEVDVENGEVYSKRNNEIIKGYMCKSGLYITTNLSGKSSIKLNKKYIISCAAGFDLRGRIVKHINGDTTDNRIKNLKVEPGLVRKNWSEYEIDFLIFSFDNPIFEFKEICSALGRSEAAVKRKVKSLKLDKKINELEVKEQIKAKCQKCGEEKTIDSFYKNNRLLSGHENVCKECRKIMNSKAMVKRLIEKGW